MFRSIMRRGIVPCLVVGLSLLPFAHLQAAPAGLSRVAAPERSWSLGWPEALSHLTAEAAGLWTKIAHPGQEARVAVDPPQGEGDGTGIDPHGLPKPARP